MECSSMDQAQICRLPASRHLDGMRVHVFTQLWDLRPLDVLDFLAILTRGQAQSQRRGVG